MPQYVDFYFLVESRASKVINEFCNRFKINRSPLAENYTLPQYAEFPNIVFSSDVDLLLHLEINFNCEYLIYWENISDDSPIKQLLAQYTNDGKIILGVSIPGRVLDNPDCVILFNRIRNYLNSTAACITSEEPPPENSIDFITLCNQRFTPNSRG